MQWEIKPTNHPREVVLMEVAPPARTYFSLFRYSDLGPAADKALSLIEAAPDMLEALKAVLASGLVKGPDPNDPGTTTPVHFLVVKAIAKATRNRT